MSMVEFIRQELAGRPQAEWRKLAQACGVPYSTLEKLIYGVTKSPTVETVEPIYNALRERAAGAAPAEKVV